MFVSSAVGQVGVKVKVKVLTMARSWAPSPAWKLADGQWWSGLTPAGASLSRESRGQSLTPSLLGLWPGPNPRVLSPMARACPSARLCLEPTLPPAPQSSPCRGG